MFEILFKDFPNFADFPWTPILFCAIVLIAIGAILRRASKGD